MVDRNSVISRLSSRVMTKGEFDFERLTAPPLSCFIDQPRIDRLYNIASSVRYSGNARKKYKAMDEIMNPLGFKKLSAGTNRVVYKHLECTSIVTKVAADAVGLGDNPSEYLNQFRLKPFVAKTFEVDPSGVIGEAERVINIRNREEFLSVAPDYFDLLNNFIIGKYIMADIGSRYFMNLGIRSGFGLVLLDYPYLYELDGNKLYCQEPDPNSNTLVCGGIIDYDDGFNHLYCQKCGKRYRAKQLAKDIEKKIIKLSRKERTEMEEIKVRVNGIRIGVATEENGLLNNPTATYVKTKEQPNPPVAVLINPKVNGKDASSYKNQNNKKQTINTQKKDQPKEESKAVEPKTEQPKAEVVEKVIEKKIEMTYEEAKAKYADRIIEESDLNDIYQKALTDLTAAEDKVNYLQKELEREQNFSNELKKKVEETEDYNEKIQDLGLLTMEVDDLNHEVKNLQGSLEFKDTTIQDLYNTIAKLNADKEELIANYNAKLNALENIITQKDTELENGNNKLTIQNTFSNDNLEKLCGDIQEIYDDDQDVGFTFLNMVFTSINTIRRSAGRPEFEQDIKVLVPVDADGAILSDGNGSNIAMFTINNIFVDDLIDGQLAEFPENFINHSSYDEENEDEIIEETTEEDVESEE